MDEIPNTFHYIHSSDLHINVKLKIGTLDGTIERQHYDKLLADPMLKFSGIYQKDKADLMVVCQVFSEGQPLALPITTSYKAFSNKWSWNEWVELPLLFSDLARDSVLALTVYDCVGAGITRAVGGTTIPLFGKHGTFRQGMLDLKVWPDRDADPKYPSKTPGKIKDRDKEQMQRLAKLAKKHRDGQMPIVEWSDRLAFREIEVINENEKKMSNFLHLMIAFPSIEVNGIPHTVVFYEQDGDDIYSFKAQADIVTIPDYEVLQENLVESKHHKLARSIRSGVSDKDLKPNAAVRDALHTIVGYPPTTQLSNEEQDLVWKFRFYLSSQNKALTKFLKCVNWSIKSENRQALELLSQWAPMDVEDALELLSRNFTQPAVRRYAVTRLQQAPDEDLLLYLLQLVQALKYESLDAFKLRSKHGGIDDEADTVSGSRNEFTNNGTKSESKLSLDEKPDYSHLDGAESRLGAVEISTGCDSRKSIDEGCDLASFLIDRATRNTTLANYFHWYLKIECEEQENSGKEDNKVREMYLTVMRTFLQALSRNQNYVDNSKKQFLKRQGHFIDNLLRIIKAVSAENANRKKKLEKLQQLLAETDKFNFTNFEPLVFPLDPSVSIKGIIPEKTTVFASALMPCRLTFLTTDNTEYLAIFKNGDDLRQDQLILQMITLMDKLLRSENLDLKLTPYRVLATSTKHGFLQFIESTTVADVLEKDGSILNYFRKYHPNENGVNGVSSHVIDNYVRSVAGYCIITYLLGVGDRHFDNLLLRTSGELFHIDFGYMLGRDPKPMPPPMKLTKEMVEAMGGETSEHYQRFRRLCYTAFLHLRRHANLILNLFSLMVDASVPDIALEPDKAVKKVQDKFRLDLTDEEAVHYIQTLIDISLSAVMPALIEQIHKFAQFLRK